MAKKAGISTERIVQAVLNVTGNKINVKATKACAACKKSKKRVG